MRWWNGKKFFNRHVSGILQNLATWLNSKMLFYHAFFLYKTCFWYPFRETETSLQTSCETDTSPVNQLRIDHETIDYYQLFSFLPQEVKSYIIRAKRRSHWYNIMIPYIQNVVLPKKTVLCLTFKINIWAAYCLQLRVQSSCRDPCSPTPSVHLACLGLYMLPGTWTMEHLYECKYSVVLYGLEKDRF